MLLKKILITFGLFILIFTLMSCKKASSSDDLNKGDIIQILQGIEDHFNMIETNQIFNFYDDDFFHRGKSIIQERIIWQDRQAQFSNLTFKNIDIDLENNYATVSFLMVFSDGQNETIFIEPHDIGDVSYFKKINNEWKIYGNQTRK